MHAQVSTAVLYELELKLSQVEKDALKAMMQNPLCPDEDAVTTNLRRVIFELLDQE